MSLSPRGKDIRLVAKEKGISINEMARNGGRKGRGIPRRYAVKPRKCTQRCPLWSVCFYKYIALDEKLAPEVRKSNPKYKSKNCVLVYQSERTKRLMKSLATGKENHFNSIIMEFFAGLMVELQTKPSQEKMKFLKQMLDVKKAIFGEKQIVEQNINMKKPVITLDEIVEAFEELKEEGEEEESGVSER